MLNQEERLEEINNYHNGKTNHRGTEETWQHLRRKFYWKNMKNDIKTFINNCQVCQRQKYDRHPNKVPFNLTETPSKPLEIVHADIFHINNKMFITFIDKFSRFAQAFQLSTKNSTEISNKIIKYFSIFGVPKYLVVDNEFNTSIINNLLKLHKVEIHLTTPKHHESNSPIERLHSTLLEHFRLINEEHPTESAKNKIRYATIAYNNSIHSKLKFRYSKRSFTIGHSESNSPFHMNLETLLVDNYVIILTKKK